MDVRFVAAREVDFSTGFDRRQLRAVSRERSPARHMPDAYLRPSMHIGR
jgi:hypothetical protein